MVLAVLSSAENLFGGCTPAVLKGGQLYQRSDLLAALKTNAYCLPVNLPRLSQPGLKFLVSTLFAYVIGLSLCWLANCLIVPGWAMSAISGGWPPATAVASTVGRLFPTGLSLALTSGKFFWDAFFTGWDGFWPGA